MTKTKDNTVSSNTYYKLIAPKYRAFSDERSDYLEAINNLVCSHAPKETKRYLDAGAGDGKRALLISSRINAAETSLLDSCADMLPSIEDCPPGVAALCMPISDINEDGQYDLITCLWNVIGHIPTRKERVDALIAMRRALSPRGRLMIDVNNRHNYEYGISNVIKNFLIGLFKPSRRGRFDLQNGASTHSVHISSHREMLQLIRESNMHIEARYTVSYRSGDLKSWTWQGQLFYVLKK